MSSIGNSVQKSKYPVFVENNRFVQQKKSSAILIMIPWTNFVSENSFGKLKIWRCQNTRQKNAMSSIGNSIQKYLRGEGHCQSHFLGEISQP